MSDRPHSEQYRIVAKQWVDAEAAASLLEDLKSAFQAERALAHAELPVNRAELIVKSSSEWREYIEKMVDARRQANRLKVQLEYLRMCHAEWQSHEATKRAEMKL